MPQLGVQRGQAVLLHADSVRCRSLEMKGCDRGISIHCQSFVIGAVMGACISILHWK